MNTKILSRFASLFALAVLGLGLFTIPAFAEITMEEPAAFPPDKMTPEEAATSGLPVLLERSVPKCPASLVDAKKPERVYVLFVVDSKGRVQNPQAAFGKHADFAKAAVEAVHTWTFKPGIHTGFPVSTQMFVTFHFKP